MDRSNNENIIAKTTSEEDVKKVRLILSNQNDVPDPYYDEASKRSYQQGGPQELNTKRVRQTIYRRHKSGRGQGQLCPSWRLRSGR